MEDEISAALKMYTLSKSQCCSCAGTDAAPAPPVASAPVPEVSFTPANDFFGDLPLIQSQCQTDRRWINVGDLDASLANQEIWIRGRLHTSRVKGKVGFVVIRQNYSTVQCVAFVGGNVTKEMLKFINSVTKESIVDIFGSVAVPQNKIESTTQQVEIQVQKFFCVSKASPVLPFQIDDASRPDPEIEKNPEAIKVLLDTRLDNRVIDLRTPANQAIMRVSSAVGMLFREALLQKDFIEIHSPKLLSGASEGGSAVFKLKYFDRDSCLAQSPQFYKQAGICADFDRVFEIGPVFRAEQSNTHRHLCEFTGLDMEMAIKEHYFEVLDVLEDMFLHIFDGLNNRFARELEAISKQHPFVPMAYKRFRLTYEEGVALLREKGVNQGLEEDLSTENERALGAIVKEKFGTDFYILHKFPLAVRPFYTMPDPADKRWSNSFDIFMRGEEIVSGAQRVHDYNLLEERARFWKIPLPTIQSYLDQFKYGAAPHGGAGVGLERVVMLFCDLHNIRKSSMFPRDPKRLAP